MRFYANPSPVCCTVIFFNLHVQALLISRDLPKQPLLVGNDGSAHLGGFHVFTLGSGSDKRIPEIYSKVTGRTKVASILHGVDNNDYIVTFSTPEHLLRFYELPSGKEVKTATKFILAEFSALCGWRSPETNAQYIYLFGKKEVRMYLLDVEKRNFRVVEVVSFVLPIEAETCAIPVGGSEILFGGSDNKLYTFTASDTPITPTVRTTVETEEEIVGAAVYHSSKKEYFYFIAFEEFITVYARDFQPIGIIEVTGGEGFELSDIAVYQESKKSQPSGLLAYAFENDEYGKGFGVSSLAPIFSDFKIKPNSDWSPHPKETKTKFPACRVRQDCNSAGYCTSPSTCSCYKGSFGPSCSQIQCPNNCSSNGSCIAPYICQCRVPFTGPDCATLSVSAQYETEASGADGDDPAIWVAPGADKTKSRIITTTKSEDNPGLSVFDIKGRNLQFLSAEEPNNVDIIYSFPLSTGERIDLAYAGCRGDNTLCLFRISSTGALSTITGGSQPLPEDFDVYGTCVYHRRRDNRFFLFANSKKATYLQFELTSNSSSLQTKLVRKFQIGTGTQPEGCVVDDDNEIIFIGEEQVGLWKYDANPERETGTGTLVDSIDRASGGRMDADVEGVALVYGTTVSQGFIIVSMQGVSSYNVYKREAPHEFVLRFTIGASKNRGVDGVTNTDGVAAVGTSLGGSFAQGLIVVHDDANELSSGGTSPDASFKLVSLADV